MRNYKAYEPLLHHYRIEASVINSFKFSTWAINHPFQRDQVNLAKLRVSSVHFECSPGTESMTCHFDVGFDKKRSTYEAASEARYRMAFAISRASPKRFISVVSAMRFHPSPSLPFMSSIRGVNVGPGHTLFTRIPRAVSSSAAVSASPRTAHFEAP